MSDELRPGKRIWLLSPKKRNCLASCIANTLPASFACLPAPDKSMAESDRFVRRAALAGLGAALLWYVRPSLAFAAAAAAGLLWLSMSALFWLWLRYVSGHIWTIAGAVIAGARPQRPAADRHQLAAGKSLLECDFAADETAGRTLAFAVRCYDNAGIGFAIEGALPRLTIAVSTAAGTASSPVPFELTLPAKEGSRNVAVASFVAYRAGEYRVAAQIDGCHVRHSPRTLLLTAGSADPGQSGFARAAERATHVLCCSVAYRLPMSFADAYGNGCSWAQSRACLDGYRIRLTDDCTGADRGSLIESSQLMERPGDGCGSEGGGGRGRGGGGGGSGRGGLAWLELRCSTPGLYRIAVAPPKCSLDGDQRQPPLLHSSARLLVLARDDWRRVVDITAKQAASSLLSSSTTSFSAWSSQPYFKARLLRLRKRDCESGGGWAERPVAQRQTVYCYVSPRQLAVKSFYFGVVPRRLCTLRNGPGLAASFLPPAVPPAAVAKPAKPNRWPVLLADGGVSVELEVKDAFVMLGCLFKWLLDAAGGSHAFEEKREHLHAELVASCRPRRVGVATQIAVEREHVVESSLAATKSLTPDSWSTVFAIKFHGEEGIDYGGLRREWIDMLLSALFDPKKSGLFAYAGNGRAIMPDYRCRLPVKFYRFAGQIVAKCIVENAFGGQYALPVRLHFARSFLAQLLGFHVDHRAFACDDPELYEKKIKYILECDDVADLELTFTDEEEGHDGQLAELGGRSDGNAGGGGSSSRRTVDVVPNGSAIAVTNGNRTTYVDALARHRLCVRIDDKTQAFVAGLYSVVPEHLLTAFDESDLELLLTGGVQHYSAADMRPHVDVVCLSDADRQALERFWTVASGFTGEQMTRLVQFVTGSSLLPPGGFAALQPRISITFDGDLQHLPVSHTCYNNLQLPSYASVEHMREALQLAISEGQGFGLA